MLHRQSLLSIWAFACNDRLVMGRMTNINTQCILVWIGLVEGPLSLRALKQAIFLDKETTTLDLAGLIDYSFGSIFNLRTLGGAAVCNETPLPSARGQAQLLFQYRNSRIEDNNDDTDNDDDDTDNDDDDDDSKGKPEDNQVFVSFKNAHVQRYFVSGKAPPNHKIRLDVPVARFAVLKTCLQVFCIENKYFVCKNSLAHYAAKFDRYLLDTEPSTAQPEERNEIGKLLAQLFLTEQPLERWISHVGHSLTTNFLDSQECMRKVQQWLQLPEDKQYLKSAPCESLFKKTAEMCARRWLQRQHTRPETDVLFLHNYKNKVSSFLTQLAASFNVATNFSSEGARTGRGIQAFAQTAFST